MAWKAPFTDCDLEEVYRETIRDRPDYLSPFMPSKDDKLQAMLDTIAFTPDDVLFDLGCGDGRVLFAALERGCPRVVGVDIDVSLLDRAREIAEAKGVSERVTLVEGSFTETDFSECSVMFLFLLPKPLSLLQPRIIQAIESGRLRIVLSNLYELPSFPHKTTTNTDWDFHSYTLS
jgi:SAM-dependent methyltransferase